MNRIEIYNGIKSQGYQPELIVDCGAFKGEWACQVRNIYNEATIIGIDAKDEVDGTIPCCDESHFTVLSDKFKEVYFYKTNSGSGTGDSMFKENTIHYGAENTVKTFRNAITLDSLLNGRVPNIIKLDTQGSEVDILRGINDIAKVDFLEIECSNVEYNIGGASIYDVFEYVADNFNIYDITEIHRLNGYMIQADYIFINKRLDQYRIKF